MGFPSAVGVVWHIADRIAVRPEISLAQASTDSTMSRSSDTNSNESWQVGVGLSGLFYLARWDALRAYVSPRFAYTHTTTTVSSPLSTTDIDSSSYLSTGSFGAQYSLGRRFSVFGEVGLTYTTGTTTAAASNSLVPPIPGFPTSTLTESRNHGVSTRSAAGVIFYF
jgi:hypothetical protein